MPQSLTAWNCLNRSHGLRRGLHDIAIFNGLIMVTVPKFIIENSTRTIIVSFLLAFAATTSAQKNPYPNELEGYKFYGNGHLKHLKIGSSKREDVKNIFGKSCSFNPDGVDDSDCSYNSNWLVAFTYLGNFQRDFESGVLSFSKKEHEGKIWEITIFPKKGHSAKRMNFGRTFSSGVFINEIWSEGSHIKPVRLGWGKSRVYSDSYGLSYDLCIKDSNKECVKGNLNSITYALPERSHRRYFDIK